MFVRALPAIAATALLWSAPALAQAPMTFALDAVMIGRIDTDERDLEPLAKSLQATLERELSGNYLIVPFATVPGYEDYDAATYLASCPAGQYVGCVYVIGSRAKANWAVAGEMSLDVDTAEVKTVFTIIDVKQSAVAVSYTAKVTPDNGSAVAMGLGMVLDSVISGLQAADDVRGHIEDPRAAWEKDREARRATATDLVEAEKEMGDLEIFSIAPSERPKMTMDEVRRWDSRDDDPPWQRIGMKPAEYVHFNNSGKTLAQWKRLQKGRFKRVMVSLGAMAGTGPYKHAYDGRWVYVTECPPSDECRFVTGETAASQQMVQGPSQGGTFDLSFGVHPWIDVGGGIAVRSFRVSYFYWREAEGDPGLQIAKGDVYRSKPEFRGHVTLAPFGTWRVRPTATAMIAYWKGTSVDRVVTVGTDGDPLRPGPDPFPAPAFVSLHLAPGAEVQLGDYLSAFARLDTSLLLSGKRQESAHTGETLLQDAYEPPALGSSLGFGAWFGVTIRVPPIGGYGDTRRIHGY